jgi:hypothetical protein
MRTRSLSQLLSFLLVCILFVAAPAHAQGLTPLTEARGNASAIVLLDGSVLAVGGQDATTSDHACLATATRYSAGSWISVSSMSSARCFSTLTLLPDGRVLVVGDGPPQIYDPAASTWSSVPQMNVPRTSGFTATLLPNGRVLVTGGRLGTNGPALADAELYDAVSNSWTTTASIPAARSSHSAIALPDGQVLVAGSLTEVGTFLFNSNTNTWSATGDMTQSHNGIATYLPDGRAIIGAGFRSRAQVYDPVSGTWTATPPMNDNRPGGAFVAAPNGKIYAMGGRAATLLPPTQTVDVYDPLSNTWSTGTSMVERRSGFPAVLLDNNKALLIGGFNGVDVPVSTTSELYGTDTSSGTPSLISLSSTTTGTGMVSVVLSGSNFAPNAFVRLGSTRVVTAYLGATRLRAFIPNSLLATATTPLLSVTNPGDGGGVSSSLSLAFTIPDRGGVSYRSAGSRPDVSVGYAAIAPEGNSSTPAGLAIFGFRRNGILVTETGVPGVRPIQAGRLYVEIGGAINTGVAFANPGGTAATISFNFTNLSGGNFDSGSFVLQAGAQISVFLNQAPFNGTLNGKGTFTFTSSVPVAAAAFRGTTNERADFLIATVPVIDLDAPASTSTLVFPTFADGGGWITQVVLVNPISTALSGTLQFMSQSGGVISSSSYSIPANSSTTVQTSGLPANPVSGSVLAFPTSGTRAPEGFVIFGFSRGGVKVTEAGVTALPISTAFRMYAESSPSPQWIQSGVAVANPSAAATTVTLEVTRLDGSSTGLTGTVTLQAKGQITRFLSEIPGLESLPANFQGVVRISSPLPISAMGLRGRYNERQDFLYTTTPPVDENAPPSSSPLYFPQVVDSGGYTTQFILFSAGPGQAPTATLRVISPSGETVSW